MAGTFQSSSSSEVSTHKVTLTFKDDGRFELLNEDTDTESEGLYESFISLKKVTFFFNNDGDTELALTGSRNFVFILEGDELELNDTVNVFSLKRIEGNRIWWELLELGTAKIKTVVSGSLI